MVMPADMAAMLVEDSAVDTSAALAEDMSVASAAADSTAAVVVDTGKSLEFPLA